MEPDVTRRIARMQHAAVRLPFTFLDEGVVARYWDQDAAIRVGFERWLGSLDLLAGPLLADDEISRRGQVLIGQSREPAQAGGNGMDTPVQAVHSGHVPPDPLAADEASISDAAGETGQRDTSDAPAAGSAPSMSPLLFLPMSTPAPWRCAESSTSGRPTISGSNAAATARGGPPSRSSLAAATATGTCWMASGGRRPSRQRTRRYSRCVPGMSVLDRLASQLPPRGRRSPGRPGRSPSGRCGPRRPRRTRRSPTPCTSPWPKGHPVRSRLDALSADPFLAARFAARDPAAGYNTWASYAEENAAQALDQYLVTQVACNTRGRPGNPVDHRRWRHARPCPAAARHRAARRLRPGSRQLR